MINIEESRRDSSLTLRVTRVCDSDSTKTRTIKTPIAILSVSEESHNSTFYQEIATVAPYPRNDDQVFCTNPFTVNSFTDSSLALRMAGAADGDSTNNYISKTPVAILSVSEESHNSICNEMITDFTSFTCSSDLVFCDSVKNTAIRLFAYTQSGAVRGFGSTKKLTTARK